MSVTLFITYNTYSAYSTYNSYNPYLIPSPSLKKNRRPIWTASALAGYHLILTWITNPSSS